MDYSKLNDTHKKRIARKAASRYVLLAHAVCEYIRLTGIIELLPNSYREEPPYKNHGDGANPTPADVFYGMSPDEQKKIEDNKPHLAEAAKIYRDAEKELLSLLPKYRHPVRNSIFVESMIFFARDPMTTATAYTWTPLMMEVKESVPEPMRSKILQGLKEGELTKGKLNAAIKERDDAADILDRARKAYQPKPKGERTDKRYARVIAELDFSDGKRPKTFKPEILYRDYVERVRRRNYNRSEAVEAVASLHRIRAGTALRELHKFRAHVKRTIQREYPESVHRDMLSYLEGLVPDTRTA